LVSVDENRPFCAILKASRGRADTFYMLSRYHTLAAIGLLALASTLGGCEAGGQFSQTLPGQKSAKAKRPAAEHASAEKDESSGDAGGKSAAGGGDAADEPVPITGTYLTCGAAQPPQDDHVVYGCNLALEATGTPVKLSRVATSWQWRYELDAARFPNATVSTRPQDGGAWQVLFDIVGGGSQAQLAQLLGALRIVLDLVPRPGTGYVPEDRPQVNGALADLLQRDGGSNGSVGGTSSGAPTGNTAAIDDGSDRPSPTNDSRSAPAAGRAPDGPVVSFKLRAVGASMQDGVTLLAALDDAKDVSDLQIEAIDSFEFRGARLTTGGGAAIDWRQRFAVRLQKAGLDCTGQGELHAGAMTIATTCR
jgi:hypothetical protein